MSKGMDFAWATVLGIGLASLMLLMMPCKKAAVAPQSAPPETVIVVQHDVVRVATERTRWLPRKVVKVIQWRVQPAAIAEPETLYMPMDAMPPELIP